MNRWLGLGSLTVLAIFLLAGARREVADASGTELVLGGYSCGASTEAAFVYMSFQTTGGIIGPDSYFQNQPPVVSSPAETCDPRAAAMREVVAGHGCALAPLSQYQDDGGGVQRSFSFVCEGSRDRIVRALAAAARALVEADAQ